MPQSMSLCLFEDEVARTYMQLNDSDADRTKLSIIIMVVIITIT